MNPVPAKDLRTNIASWAVPPSVIPAVAGLILGELPREVFDPSFFGQHINTHYFDTLDFLLQKARKKGDKYLTLRVRCYKALARDEAYALSAKTEEQKFRVEIDEETADFLTSTNNPLPKLMDLLPGDLGARLMELTDDQPLLVVTKVHAHRYAVEDAKDRFTFDVDVSTDSGKQLPFGVLEFKSTDENATPPGGLFTLNLRPIKISKFLWATRV
jgi:hypothetical protein